MADQSHDELLAQFISLTEANQDMAQMMLESSGWHLENAINNYMEMQSGGISASTPASNTATTSFQDEEIRQALPSRHEQLIEDHYTVPEMGFVSPESMPAFSTSGNQRKRDLAALFAPPTDLIFPANFRKASEHATDHQRWLLVNIQAQAEFASHQLNRDVWSSEICKDIIRQEFIFWQQWHTTPAAKEFMQRYHISEDQLPVSCIIDPRTGEKLWQRVGYYKAEQFIASLSSFLSENSFSSSRPPVLDIHEHREEDVQTASLASSGPSTRVRRTDETEAKALSQAIAQSLKESREIDLTSSSSTNQARQNVWVSSAQYQITDNEDDSSVEYISGSDDEIMSPKGTSEASTTVANSSAGAGTVLPKPELTLKERFEQASRSLGLVQNIEQDLEGDTARVQILLPDKRIVWRISKDAPVSKLYAVVGAQIGQGHSLTSRYQLLQEVKECSEDIPPPQLNHSIDTWDIQQTFPAQSISSLADQTIQAAKLSGASIRVVYLH